jgi:Rab9 effector protein with kelch motifs
MTSLGDVPEEETFSPTSSHSDEAVPSSSTSNGSRVPGGSRKTPSIRTLGRSSTSDALPSATSKRNPSSSSTATKDARTQKAVSASTLKKTRSTPRLPHDKDADPAPSTSMYWSRAPVYGTIPPKFMRGHSVTLVDAIAWLFGGCDDKDLKENPRDMKIIYCFDTGTTSPIVPRSS